MKVKETSSRVALGRGLKALFPTADATAPVAGDVKNVSGSEHHIYQIPIEKIIPQPHQPRQHINEQALHELIESIKQDGIIQPIIVRRSGEQFEIVAGERRWRASQKAGLTAVPALIKDFSDEESFEIALIENIQRSDLTPIEEAQAYRRLIDQYSLTQEQVAKRVGKDRSTVTNTLRLLQLPEKLYTHINEGDLSAGHARAILSLKDDDARLEMANEVIDNKLSVRKAESLAKKWHDRGAKAAKRTSARAQPPSSSERDLIERLQRALGTKVTLDHSEGKGKVEIHFYSYAELDRIVDALMAKPN